MVVEAVDRLLGVAVHRVPLEVGSPYVLHEFREFPFRPIISLSIKPQGADIANVRDHVDRSSRTLKRQQITDENLEVKNFRWRKLLGIRTRIEWRSSGRQSR